MSQQTVPSEARATKTALPGEPTAQATRLLVCGIFVLYVACAAGVRLALRAGRAGTSGPLLVGALGVGLIVAGVFLTDADAGFPPGALAGAPERISWHGIGHEVGFMVALMSWTAACFVFVRRFAALKWWGWVALCVAAPVAVLGLESWPDLDSLNVRILIGTATMFGFMAAVAARLVRGLPHMAATSVVA